MGGQKQMPGPEATGPDDGRKRFVRAGGRRSRCGPLLGPVLGPHMRAAFGVVTLCGGAFLLTAVAFLRPGPAALVAILVAARYLVLTVALRQARLLDEAEEAAREDPTSAERHFRLAEARLARGQFGAAVAAFRNGVGLSPELNLERPSELARSLLGRRGLTPARRRDISRLIAAAVLDRWLEDIDVLAAHPAFQSMPFADEPEGPDREGKESFLVRCRVLAASLRAEIAGLEQMRSQLHVFLSGDERTREAVFLTCEIERLRARAEHLEGEIERGRACRPDDPAPG